MKPKTKPVLAPSAYTISYVKGKKHIQLHVPNTQITDWVDKQELQNHLHISDRTLHTLRKTRRIPYSNIGGKFYYFMPGILALLEQNLP